MRVLGAVLAGGRSTRFGSDKALARVDGKMLIDHAIVSLGAHAERVVICGRPWRGARWIEDIPARCGGPLAGLNAALHYARAHGFAAVLCAPVDVHPLHDALPLLAGKRCATLETQCTVGIWPSSLAPVLDRHLAEGSRAFKSWLEVARSVRVSDKHLPLRNINHATDLDQAQLT